MRRQYLEKQIDLIEEALRAFSQPCPFCGVEIRMLEYIDRNDIKKWLQDKNKITEIKEIDD